MNCRLPSTLIFAACLLVTGIAGADDVEQKIVLDGLANPCGVAVQPGSGDVYVADSAALRIIKVDAKTGESSPAITGFPKDVYGKGPKYDIGPLGLAFLGGPNTLVVGGGGNVDGSEIVRVYDLSGGKTLTAGQLKHKVGPIGPGTESLKGEGNFYGIAVSDSAIYVTCNGDDTKGWISRSELSTTGPGPLTPFIKTKVATDVDAPVGITLSKEGNLVVGQMGEMNVPRDSLLTIYDDQGQLITDVETELFDIAGVAYSPKTGHLYAVDFAWADTKQGGLFRLDIKGEGDNAEVTATKIVSLDRPTAIAFSPEGDAYVTAFGGGANDSGVLVKISGSL